MGVEEGRKLTADEKEARDSGMEMVVGFDHEGSHYEVWAKGFRLEGDDHFSIEFDEIGVLKNGTYVTEFPETWSGAKMDVEDAAMDAIAAYCDGSVRNVVACPEIEKLKAMCPNSGFSVDGRPVPGSMFYRMFGYLHRYDLSCLTDKAAFYSSESAEETLITNPATGKVKADQGDFPVNGIAESVLRGDKVLFVGEDSGEWIAELCEDTAETEEEKKAAAAFRAMVPEAGRVLEQSRVENAPA